MARRSDHSREEIRDMAIAAATAILTRDGAQALSTRGVAKAIGYTVGTLYLVFRNLDDLILHINAATLTELEQMIRQDSQLHTGPQPQLFAIAHAYWRFAHEHTARWALLFTHRLPEGTPNPAWFEQKVRELFAVVEAPLRAIKPTADTASLTSAARALWGGVHGVCELALSDKLEWGDSVASEAVLDALVGNFLGGYKHNRSETC